MVIPPEIADLAGDRFYSQFSREQIGLLDRDVLIWITSEPGIVSQIKADPLRQQLDAVAQGREIFLIDMESGRGLVPAGVLSLPYLLDTLVPKLAAAADGDPTTSVE
jgi:iron complex transport system substrate-binding protein